MTRATVISLDDALRLTRANTHKAPLYLQKADALDDYNRKRLLILEEWLYKSKSTAGICECGQLRKLTSCFEGPEGKIYWFFSIQTRKFVLLDFEFYSGGPGGLRCSYSDTDQSGHPIQLYAATQARLRAAARHDLSISIFSQSILSIASLPKSRHSLSCAKDLFDGSSSRSKGYKLHNSFFALTKRFLSERSSSFSESMYVIPACYNKIEDLPRWSILSSYISAPEQLSNAYARSILAGEALCRLAVPRFEGSLCKKRRYTDIAQSLLEDTVSTIDCIFDVNSKEPSKDNRYEIIKAFSRDLIGDDFLLAIARSELTAHLSLYVAGFALKNTPKIIDEHKFHSIKSRDAVHARVVMKKYALLSEFVILFECLLRPRKQPVWQTHCDENLNYLRAKKIETQLLRSIGDFDIIIHQLVSRIMSSSVEKQPWEMDDLSFLHERMLRITEEMLTSQN